MQGGWPWENRATPRGKAVDDEAGMAVMQLQTETAEDGRGRPRTPELEESGKDSTWNLRRNQPCQHLDFRLVASTSVNEYIAVGSTQ